MNRLRTIKKYFKDLVLEKTFIDILSKVHLYDMTLKHILLQIDDTKLIQLQLFYNTTNYNRLIEKLQNDIDYILELE